MDVPLDLTSYVRVLKMASTPSWNEFSQVAKIAGAGILLIGLIGFLIAVTMNVVVPPTILPPELLLLALAGG